ncbi:MAG: tyrosine-type recombinase/integrase [Candidatus Hodarchaeota archaeon]
MTISGDLCILWTLYEYLFHFGKMDHNPAKALLELICRPPPEADYLTVDECFRLLDFFDTNALIGLRNYTIVALLWATGIRNNELCNLNWSDIHLSDSALLVRDGKGGAQR